MTRDDIKKQLQSQYDAIQDIMQLCGVCYNTSFYAYLSTASYGLGLALTRVNEYEEEDDNGDTEANLG